MHLVHCDHNYIYNFWPHEGESIAQSWGRMKSISLFIKEPVQEVQAWCDYHEKAEHKSSE